MLTNSPDGQAALGIIIADALCQWADDSWMDFALERYEELAPARQILLDCLPPTHSLINQQE